MPFCHLMPCPTGAAGEPAVADADADAAGGEPGAAPAPDPAPRNGRGRRVRFGDVFPDTPSRAVTGSIAISFAVVSRRHWPR